MPAAPRGGKTPAAHLANSALAGRANIAQDRRNLLSHYEAGHHGTTPRPWQQPVFNGLLNQHYHASWPPHIAAAQRIEPHF
jgi:hypothetical protein